MIKYSVKKPMTVFVVIIAIIALGVVSLLGMTPDLLPSIDLPYMVVVTTYPGATPEEVAETVTKPLEQSLATLENIKTIQSVSNANYSMIIMEFENGSSMETAVVDTLQDVDLVEANWDDTIGAPYIMKINPSMLPIAVAAVDMEGYTTEEISSFVDDTLMNQLEGITGVASISTGGMIESQINVKISEKKIEKLNNKLVKKINGDLADSRSQLQSGLSQIKSAQSQLSSSARELEKSKNDTYDKLAEASAQLDTAVSRAASLATQIQVLEGRKAAVQAQIDNNMYGEAFGISLEDLMSQLTDISSELAILQIDSAAAEEQVSQLQSAYQEAERGTYTAVESFGDAESQLSSAKSQLSSQRSKLESAMSQLDSASEEALKQADLGSMITVEMVSGVLQGQNFSMPAGYIQKDDAQLLVSVGDEIEDLDELKDLYLFKVDGLGVIRLKDVADVFMSDNSDEVYASINGNPGVLLTFSKQSNYATATVSNNIKDKFESLESKYEGLHFSSLMDQGDYIYLIIGAILESLGYGALFAVLILLLFLRNLKPTLITLLSIPISITFAIVLMYFTGVTINMISLSGLAIAVGMLVDNSIVVIENIFRLRREGVPPKKAAIAGAKEVGGAITASTLTNVCVFAPIVFTHGITRQLFTDLALTVTYSLMASLIIALTLVPSMASSMFKKEMKPEGEGAGSLRHSYQKILNWNLNHKFLVLLLAVVLLVYSVYASVSKGLIFIPDMATPQLSGSLTMNDEDATLEETQKMADKVLKTISEVEGVETVGGMLASTSAMGGLMGDTDTTSLSLYVIVDEEAELSGGEIARNVEEACKDYDCTVEILSSSSVTEYTTALGGSGVTLNVYSTDTEDLEKAVKKIGKALEKVEGIAAVNNGLTDAEPEYHFTVDKDEAMKRQMTVAQVYMAVSDALSTTKTPTTLKMDGDSYDIVVSSSENSEISLSDIKNLRVEYTNKDGETKHVKLSKLCTVEKEETLPSIARMDQRTYLSVSAELEEGYNVTLVTTDCEKAVSELKLPKGVTYEFNGENEMIMDAMVDLLEMMGLGILLVYLIMVAQFQSLKSPFIIMFTIPLALTGGLGALLIFDKEISIMAMIGLVMLVGIIVNNGIVLVDYTNQLRARGYNKRAAILMAASTRIKPVLMTSLTTILGLIVMAVGKTAGTDMMQPIALVCIGGLTYATLLTLLVVPVIYDIFNGEVYKHTKEEDLDISGLIAE